jgi:hypothetical protein
MSRSLLGLARRHQALWPAGQRAYASAADVALAEESPFLRFATPVPQPSTFTPVLSSLPETAVR